jgi:glutamyl-Q tRNA(Asp) synthetase
MAAITTRFAPSPTGYLHLGHAAAACFAAEQAADGRFLLRIEDIDHSRCRDEFVAAILADLAWLGLRWEPEVRRQSSHFADYRAALDQLAGRDLLYPCFCTRGAIAREIAAIGGAPHGPDGPIYPGSCRALRPAERDDRMRRGEPFALRLKMDDAMRLTGPLTWQDVAAGPQTARPEMFGDVVLARKDCPASYHLAVTLDDARQGVTLVTRGVDLFAASHLHRLLQALLGLPVPLWHHHPLLTDDDGHRLAKRAGAPTLRSLREQGVRPEQIRRLAAFGAGSQDRKTSQRMSGGDQRFQPVLQHMGIDLRGGDVGMAEHLLQAAQVGAAGQQMAGEGMAQHVRR